jgi:hypothetical protein
VCVCVCVCVALWECPAAPAFCVECAAAGGGSSYVSIRQHTPAYASIRQHTQAGGRYTPAYVSIRQHTSAYLASNVLQKAWGRLRPNAGLAGVAGVAGGAVRRQRTPPAVALCARPPRAPAYVSMRQHMSAYVSAHTRQWLCTRVVCEHLHDAHDRIR